MVLKLDSSSHERSPGQADPIAMIQGRLLAYPHVRYHASPSQITVHPIDASGFEVAVGRHRSQYVVECDGWHEHYDSPDHALEVFFLSLSPGARLIVWQRGRFRHRWRLEVSSEGHWNPISEVGLLVFPFWRPLRILTLQNRLLQAA